MFGNDVREWHGDGLTLLLRTYPPGQHKPVHVHSGPTFFLVLAGGMRERCGGREVEAGPYRVVSQSAAIEHSTTVAHTGMRALFIEASEGGCDAFPIEERVLALCAGLEDDAGDSDGIACRRLRSVQEMLHEAYDKPLSLSGLAEAAGVHPVHLARTFRARHGRSISAYLRAIRVKEALRRADRAPLGMIAAECGFADQSHMCRSVRRELGRTPREILSALRRD